MSRPSSRAELASRFSRYNNGKEFDKAVDAAFGGCVKRHLFLPSGRRVFTVVGRNSDEFIDPERSYCSCESYFFRVLGKKADRCYHILSYELAAHSGLVDEVKLSDEEYDTFMRILMSDVLRSRNLGKR